MVKRRTSATGTRSVPDARRGRGAGFTLLELILAIALIGLAVTFVTLSFGGIGTPRATDAARALADRIALAHEEIAFDGRVLGLRWRPGRTGDDAEGQVLEFVVLARDPDDPSRTVWEPADPRDALLAPTRLGAAFEARLEVEGAAVGSDGARPAVLLLPDGELTPFALTLTPVDDEASAVRLVAGADGAMRIEAAPP